MLSKIIYIFLAILTFLSTDVYLYKKLSIIGVIWTVLDFILTVIHFSAQCSNYKTSYVKLMFHNWFNSLLGVYSDVIFVMCCNNKGPKWDTDSLLFDLFSPIISLSSYCDPFSGKPQKREISKAIMLETGTSSCFMDFSPVKRKIRGVILDLYEDVFGFSLVLRMTNTKIKWQFDRNVAIWLSDLFTTWDDDTFLVEDILDDKVHHCVSMNRLIETLKLISVKGEAPYFREFKIESSRYYCGVVNVVEGWQRENLKRHCKNFFGFLNENYIDLLLNRCFYIKKPPEVKNFLWKKYQFEFSTLIQKWGYKCSRFSKIPLYEDIAERNIKEYIDIDPDYKDVFITEAENSERGGIEEIFLFTDRLVKVQIEEAKSEVIYETVETVRWDIDCGVDNCVDLVNNESEHGMKENSIQIISLKNKLDGMSDRTRNKNYYYYLLNKAGLNLDYSRSEAAKNYIKAAEEYNQMKVKEEEGKRGKTGGKKKNKPNSIEKFYIPKMDPKVGEQICLEMNLDNFKVVKKTKKVKETIRKVSLKLKEREKRTRIETSRLNKFSLLSGNEIIRELDGIIPQGNRTNAKVDKTVEKEIDFIKFEKILKDRVNNEDFTGLNKRERGKRVKDIRAEILRAMDGSKERSAPDKEKHVNHIKKSISKIIGNIKNKDVCKSKIRYLEVLKHHTARMIKKTVDMVKDGEYGEGNDMVINIDSLKKIRREYGVSVKKTKCILYCMTAHFGFDLKYFINEVKIIPKICNFQIE